MNLLALGNTGVHMSEENDTVPYINVYEIEHETAGIIAVCVREFTGDQKISAQEFVAFQRTPEGFKTVHDRGKDRDDGTSAIFGNC